MSLRPAWMLCFFLSVRALMAVGFAQQPNKPLPLDPVIDFEDLSPGGPNGPTPLAVTRQYATAKGVIFSGASAVDYSQSSSAIPGFAHSGTKAIEACLATPEFCSSPIGIEFTTPQRRVKVWAGYASSLNQRRTVVLQGLDDGGGLLGETTGSIGPSDGPIPASVALELIIPRGNIRHAVVRFLSSGTNVTPQNNHLVIDDVEFDTVGPPPTCDSTRVPVAAFDQPSFGQTVQRNEFVFAGVINTVAPLIEATLNVTATAGSRSLDLLSSNLIAAGPGVFRFGPGRVNEMLFPGANRVSISVRDCRGPAEASTFVHYSPVDQGTRIKVLGIEFNQSIQDMNNTIPLVAEKRTAVRVYLATEGASSTLMLNQVSGFLSACRPRLTFPFCESSLSPGRVESLNAITVEPSTTLWQRRQSFDRSLNFELPANWLTEGDLHISLRLELEGEDSIVPCVDCDNTTQFGRPVFAHFQTTPPVRLFPVSVGYTKSGATFWPRAMDFDFLYSWLSRAYPTARLLLGRACCPGSAGASIQFNHSLDYEDACDDVNEALEDLDGYGDDPRVRYYGLVSDGGGSGPFFMRGCVEEIPGNNGSGPAGAMAGFASWDTDGSYADFYGGHEIGHLYGREHPGFNNCGGDSQDRDDDNYPYPGGFLGNIQMQYFGFDGGDASISAPPQVISPIMWSDIMTYNCFEWLSDYTYKAILDRIRLEEAFPALLPVPPGADSIRISAKIDLTTESVRLGPFWRAPGLRPTSRRPGLSSYSIDLEDKQGKVLARYPFRPHESSDIAPGKHKRALIAEVVPYLPGTERIVISHEGRPLSSRTVSRNKPKVRILFPNGGETLGGNEVTVKWEATDADGDQLVSTLFYSTDAGKNWRAIASRIEGTEYTVQLRDLPGSDYARFRIMTTDGVNATTGDSDDNFRVPPTPPQVRIVSPAASSKFLVTQTIILNGYAVDRQDGDLEGKNLQWATQGYGILGYGRSIVCPPLLPGKYQVTLLAKDTDGLASTATVEIEIGAVPPIADAGGDQTAVRGATVPLLGTTSTGIGPLAYEWDTIAKPDGSNVHIFSDRSSKAHFIPDVLGRYVIQLTVKDATETFSIDRITVQVNDAKRPTSQQGSK